MQNTVPNYLQNILRKVSDKLKSVKQTHTKTNILENRQAYLDEVLQIYQDAFEDVIENTITCAPLLKKIKSAYDNALSIRDERILQLITRDSVFEISKNKNISDSRIMEITIEREKLQEENRRLTLEIIKLEKKIGKINDENFFDYLSLMRERDARYTLYFENLSLHLKLKELDGARRPSVVDDVHGDPVILRIALNKCREQLSFTQTSLKKLTEEYSESVPLHEHEMLESKFDELAKGLKTLRTEYELLQKKYRRVVAQKNSLEEELAECKERCHELERAGTPRPRWEVCADFISGGRERWWQLANGLSSKEKLRVLLKELGPAAESEHLEYFDGFGLDPVIPPYLRYEGRVRNLRLSRREVSVIINDIWLGKLHNGKNMSMLDYVTKYFEDRYQQTSVRAEWAYNLCAGAEQMLDEPQVKLFWGVLHGHLSEHCYWNHRAQWQTLRDQLHKHCRDGETISIEEFEKVTRATFPLKSEVDIKNLTDIVKKQLKLKLNNTDINLDKLFFENEEGFDRVDFARELFRQRRMAQDKYIREIVAELGIKNGNKYVTVDNLKRAFAVVDPAIDHIRMDKYIRWAFSDQNLELNSISPSSLRSIVSRLAAGEFERVGPRYKGTRRRFKTYN